MQKLMIITLDLMQHTRNKTNMRYIKRTIDTTLEEQKNSTQRKPLLLRGARQVGKSSTIRELSKKFSHFVEVNFESEKAVRTFFEGNLNPHQICDHLSLYYETPIIPGKHYCFQTNIIPLEIKSETKGSMHSLHLFMEEKHLSCTRKNSMSILFKHTIISL